MSVVEFKNVDVIFGPKPERALALLDKGESREEILEHTQSVLGVAGANLSVEEGQICVLMGLSGSGKSSLLRCVNGLNKVTRGSLTVRHGDRIIDVATCDAATLRDLRMNRIAMVFQQFGLLPWRTVSENVGLGLELKGLPKEQISQTVAEKLQLVHLEQWAHKFVSELSGGMQQRVGLARAFATDADILLMDEPFSALDPLIRDHLQDELLELQRSLKKTIIFVSHDLDEALKIGNQIVIMDGGHIVQKGRAEDIVFEPANEYVRKFVANMNPLNVLNAVALMRPLEAFERSGARVMLPEGLSVDLDEHGAPVAAQQDGVSRELWSLETRDPVPDHPLPLADWEASMRPLVSARRRFAQPILIVKQGVLIGVVGEQELYDGLLRQDTRH